MLHTSVETTERKVRGTTNDSLNRVGPSAEEESKKLPVSPGYDEDTGEAAGRAVRQLFEQVYSKGRLSAIEDLIAAGFTGTSTVAGEPIEGPAGVSEHVAWLHTVFHGFRMEIESLAVDGNGFEVVWTARGSHERRFLGVEPACVIGRAGQEPRGTRIVISGRATGTVQDGTIQACRLHWDTTALENQLGGQPTNSK